MAEIEDVPVAATGTAEDILDAALDLMERGIQRDGVKIALHGTVVSNQGPGFVQVNPPVDADHVPAGLSHLP